MTDHLTHRSGYDFAFDPGACSHCGGRCCNGDSGDIFLNKREAAAIADHLALSPSEFRKRFTRKKAYKTSLLEVQEGENFRCIFFEPGTGCCIYPVRPLQCRTYPFWGRFINDPDSVTEECPGIRPHSG